MTSPNFCADRGRVPDGLGLSIHLDDAIGAYALSEVLVRSPDTDLFNLRVIRGQHCGGSQRIVRFQLDHRPYRHAHGLQSLHERMELRGQRGLDPGAGLVAAPELVAERFDDVVGRDAQVSRVLLDHLQHGVEDARYRAIGAIGALGGKAPQAVEMTEQLRTSRR